MKHLIGTSITVDGRYVRQLCQWCGKRLVDVDLSLVAVPEDHEGLPYPEWPVGEWLDVVEGDGLTTAKLVTGLAEEKIPMGCCMEDVSPRLRAVPKGEG